MEIYLELSDNENILIGEVPHTAVKKSTISFVTWKSEFDDFMKLVGRKVVSPAPVKYEEMCKALNVSGRNAALTIPKAVLKTHLKKCLEDIQDALCDTENAEYLVTYLTIKRFLQSLTRASVDLAALKSLINESKYETVISNLKTFLPLQDEKCKKVQYSTNNTSTGRLTVLSGPQILTAPAKIRQCLKSRYKNGKIIQIDLISAEPKFALHVKGEKVPVDVYKFVSENILNNDVQRHHAKLITLCSLYGQSAKNLEKQLPPGVNPRKVIRETRRYFDYDRLKSRLHTDFINGNFRNAIGRPIKVGDNSEHLLISYYLQSSVAEAAILMFSQFYEKFSNHCDPLFIIHDALLLDCQESFADSLLQKKQIKLSLGDWKFDASIKDLRDS